METKRYNKETVLVVGATGLLGMEICTQLLDANMSVRALVRTTSSPEKVKILGEMGAEIFTGDIKDQQSLEAAFSGATAVISTATATSSQQPGDSIESVDQQGQLNVIEAALHAGVSKFVFVSVHRMSYASPLETAKRTVEIVLKETGMRYTILQPTVFMEVWLSPYVGMNYPSAEATIYGEGKTKLTWISLKDVASIAVASLDNPVAENATIVLGGPQALTPLEVVNIFERYSGKPFTVQHVPVEALLGQYTSATDSMSKTFAALMLAYAEGNELDMRQVEKDFDIKLAPLEDYVAKVTATKSAETANA